MTVLADPPAAATGESATVAAAASTSGTKCLGLRVTGPSKQLGLVVHVTYEFPCFTCGNAGAPYLAGLPPTAGGVVAGRSAGWTVRIPVNGGGSTTSMPPRYIGMRYCSPVTAPVRRTSCRK